MLGVNGVATNRPERETTMPWTSKQLHAENRNVGVNVEPLDSCLVLALRAVPKAALEGFLGG
jgi:hypothetical protein